jgi:methanogenic corrinoid protein MtbC1
MRDANNQATSTAPDRPASAGLNPDSDERGKRWTLKPVLQPAGVVRTLKAQILPRLVLALRNGRGSGAAPDADDAFSRVDLRLEDDSIAAFAAMACGHDDAAPFRHVEALTATGWSAESIFLDLLAPTARHLGMQWELDTADFATVTLGVSRLQRIMRRLGDTFYDERCSTLGAESIMLTIVPGEQHSFGLSMVSEFFRRAGWNMSSGAFGSGYGDLNTLLRGRWFDVVGFSLSSDRGLDELRREIRVLRGDSMNHHIGVLLGGPMVSAHPELVAALGADMMSDDATTASDTALGLVRQMHNRA